MFFRSLVFRLVTCSNFCWVFWIIFMCFFVFVMWESGSCSSQFRLWESTWSDHQLALRWLWECIVDAAWNFKSLSVSVNSIYMFFLFCSNIIQSSAQFVTQSEKEILFCTCAVFHPQSGERADNHLFKFSGAGSLTHSCNCNFMTFLK